MTGSRTAIATSMNRSVVWLAAASWTVKLLDRYLESSRIESDGNTGKGKNDDQPVPDQRGKLFFSLQASKIHEKSCQGQDKKDREKRAARRSILSPFPREVRWFPGKPAEER